MARTAISVASRTSSRFISRISLEKRNLAYRRHALERASTKEAAPYARILGNCEVGYRGFATGLEITIHAARRASV